MNNNKMVKGPKSGSRKSLISQVTAGIFKILRITRRECSILVHNPIYFFCMIIGPILVTVFFTSLMDDGQPTDMPCGIVDLDNTSTARAVIR